MLLYDRLIEISSVSRLRRAVLVVSLTGIICYTFMTGKNSWHSNSNSGRNYDLPLPALEYANWAGSEEPPEYNARATRIPIAAVSCGKQTSDLKAMLKSAMIFSQDAHLHAIIIADEDSVNPIATDLLELKRAARARGWHFTFHLRLKEYPGETEQWFNTKRWLCSTQRLFFPSVLSDVDSVLYLDTDVIILSNLTEMWTKFVLAQKNDRVLAGFSEILPSPAKGLYWKRNEVPYYGSSGLNAGIILMNLTRMREFQIEKLCTEAYQKYKGKLAYLDQDIYNIVFHTHPERLMDLDCTYNFHRGHCGNGPKQICDYHTSSDGPLCFCQPALTDGVRIVHGCGRTFSPQWPFLQQLQGAFKEVDIFNASFFTLIDGLKSGFDSLKQKPACFNLTSDTLYMNAESYLHNLK